MAESLINSIARLRVIEKRLLSKEFVTRLAGAESYEDSVRMLREAGFGAAYAGGGDELEGLIAAHLAETYALVSELMPKRLAFITDVFRMRHDLTNIKLLYKTRLLGGDLSSAAQDPGGVFDCTALSASIAKGDYSMLPRKLEKTLEELDVLTYKNPDARLVSEKLDGAYLEYGLGLGNAFVRAYFSATADFTNLIAITRGAGFVPCGEYDESRLNEIASALAETPEKIPGLLKTPFETSPLKEAAKAGFENYLKTRNASALEKARDEYLVSLAAGGRSDIDSPAPIVGFLLAREREAEVVRLILTVKRSGISMNAVDERSLVLYG